MAATRKLKVYATTIGFHDAYVAAVSQKAALTAWGSTHDLFARGVAQLVSDPSLTAEPLANPGKVVKRLRGTAAEQIAALPADTGSATKKAPAKQARRVETSVKPPPDRADLQAAETALAAAEADRDEDLAALEEREQALRGERAAAEQRHARTLKGLEQARAKAEKAYRAQLDAWEG